MYNTVLPRRGETTRNWEDRFCAPANVASLAKA